MKEMDPEKADKIREAVEEFGTPLYLYDFGQMKKDYSALRQALPDQIELHYSMKANPNPRVCSQIFSWGASAEVASLAEYMSALRLGVKPDSIVFTGPGKSRGEIRTCLKHGIYCINAESWQEILEVNAEAERLGIVAPIMIRVNLNLGIPGSRMSSGGIPSQFGIDEDQLETVASDASRLSNIRLLGLHTYQGTQNFRLASFEESIPRMFQLSANLQHALCIRFSAIGLGGGFAVPYFEGDGDFPLDEFRIFMEKQVREWLNREDNTYDKVFMESGRFLTARMGFYAASVLYTKVSRTKRFAVLDGGTHHRAALSLMGRNFKQPLPVYAISGGKLYESRESEAAESAPVTLVGKLCSPADVLQSHVQIPELRPGDLVVFGRSGAYGLTFGNVHFLSHPLPSEVVLNEEGRMFSADWLGLDPLKHPLQVSFFQKNL